MKSVVSRLRKRRAKLWSTRRLKIASSMFYDTSGWGYGLSPDKFREEDVVGINGSFFGGSAYDIVVTGNVKLVDLKARKIHVHLHQAQDSRSTPSQFDPEDLILLHRPKEGEKTVTVPILRHQSYLGQSGPETLDEE